MDILRKELNGIYLSQNLDDELLDDYNLSIKLSASSLVVNRIRLPL